MSHNVTGDWQGKRVPHSVHTLYDRYMLCIRDTEHAPWEVETGRTESREACRYVLYTVFSHCYQ